MIAARVEPSCAAPHQGCGCELDASQGSHEGPCDQESDGYCGKCAQASAEYRRGACPDCGGTGTVAVHVCRDERECARRCLQVQACMSCLGEKTA